LKQERKMKRMGFCLITLPIIITMTISCTTIEPVTDIKTATKTVAKVSKRYPELKSAIIKYNVSGMDTGTEVVYIDDWGRREAIYRKVTTMMMGIKLERNYMTLITDNGKWIYNVDFNTRTAVKMNNARYKALTGNSSTNMGEVIGARKIGTEEVAGRVCEVWKKGYPYSMAWIWKGIALKKDREVADTGVLTVATEAQENISIPEDKFTIPPDIKIKVLDARTLIGG
jgi:hypothetical protein